MTNIDEAQHDTDHADTAHQDDDFPTGMLASPTRTRL